MQYAQLFAGSGIICAQSCLCTISHVLKCSLRVAAQQKHAHLPMRLPTHPPKRFSPARAQALPPKWLDSLDVMLLSDGEKDQFQAVSGGFRGRRRARGWQRWLRREAGWPRILTKKCGRVGKE